MEEGIGPRVEAGSVFSTINTLPNMVVSKELNNGSLLPQ